MTNTAATTATAPDFTLQLSTGFTRGEMSDHRSYKLETGSGLYVGLESNVDRWLALGAAEIADRLAYIWDGVDENDSLSRALALPLLAQAVYVADCDGPIHWQLEAVAVKA